MSMSSPSITVVVPSYNQARFLDKALDSIFSQQVNVEVFVMDGGSTDGSLEVISNWERRLSGWRSFPDDGQSAAVNEGIRLGNAPFVCWLNSDDWYLPNGLLTMLRSIRERPDVPMVYGRCKNYLEERRVYKDVWTQRFTERRMATRCIVCQPGTLIRRACWEALDGLDESLSMAMDYDFWWRVYRKFGEPLFLDEYVAVNREHELTKTRRFRKLHYKEAIDVVRRYSGSVPIKWWVFQPYSVWLKKFMK